MFSSSGPFTFDGTACVSVTDDFDKGDQFTVYDNGQPVGTTPAVPVVTTGLELGPDAAYFDSTYSSGSFLVTGDAGHSISIEVVSNPFGGGRGYLRVDSPESAFCDGECGLVFAVVTPPQHGSVSVITQTTGTTGEIVYTPDESFSGIDSFTYSVTDCYGNVATGTVTVTVTDSSPCVECDRVTVQLAGSGSGTVTSNPLIVDSNSGLILGILCPDLCETDFTAGSAVGLQARPEGTSVFTGWGGDCSGSSPLLVISLSSDMTCTATFEAD
ncbi:MAG: Ig-like domain-containing protein [Thermoanaerobaculia bacterium]